MARKLGLDLGSNSLGWAIVDTTAGDIIAMGVRIFTEGVANIDTINEESRNAQRRMKRQIRRQYERRRRRKDALRAFLIELGLLPADPLQYEEVFATDPYELRAKGLDEPLSAHELGRVVDHINARRGFRSNRKAASDEEDSGVLYEGSKDDAKPGINAISENLDPRLRKLKDYDLVRQQLVLGSLADLTGNRTAGEYLAQLDPHQVRRRKRFLLREHLEIELDLLLRKQAEHHHVLTTEVQEKLKKLTFWQRPLRSVRHLVGNCRFEPQKKRAHKSHPEYQRFRMLQQVNNLEVFGPGRVLDDDRKLKAGEREALINHLSTDLSIDTDKGRSKITKLMGLPTKSEYKFNIERLDACGTERSVCEAIGRDRWLIMSKEEQHELWNVLNLAESREWLEEYSVKKWGLTQEQAKALAKVRLEDGYGSLSLRAIRRILPYLEEGRIYNEACVAAGYHHSQPDEEPVLTDTMPMVPHSEIRNPIVITSFSEMRKVVNLLIKRYGPFDSIHVEMARELKKPKADRLKIEKRNKGFRDENEIIRGTLRKEFGVDKPTKADVERYKLWEEQNHKCMYTGKPISQDMLFSGPVDVDHILPYSRTLDDSRTNKVLCLREINQAKGNLTPREACNAGIINYDQLRERVESLVRANKVTKLKSTRIFMTEEEMSKVYGDFVERQLNDTRYVGRLALKYLRYVCKDIVVANGLLTSSLRRRWGLNSVIPELAAIGRAWIDKEAISNGAKSRADHRHHAIDALVVALTDRGLLQRVSTLNARESSITIDKHVADGRIRLPEEPIPGMLSLTKERVDKIIVSHKVRKKRRGQLHEETIYGLAHDENGVPLLNESGIPLYVVRKPLSSITAGEAAAIVDPVVKTIVYERLASLGVDTSGKFTMPKNAFAEPLFMPRKNGQRGPQIRRVRVYKPSSGMVRLREHGAYVEPGSNDHIRVFERDGSGKRTGTVHTLLEATSRSFKPARAEYTLRLGELYAFSDVIETGSIYRVQQIGKTDQRVVFRHATAATIQDKESRVIKVINSLDGVRIRVDAIGQVV